MPTYEYRCDSCNHQFEVFARMSDPAPEACEGCGAAGTLTKVLFPVAVHYKGSGFYSTDYSGSKQAAKSDSAGSGEGSSSSGDSAGGASGGTDSTSAASSTSPSTSSSNDG